ncbi:hypothetical protein [Flavihumibacter solisilvae]|uniref:Uncharacterized protein n=1 Tax=Flavihumibacter solisilvae TaxID=1349421 RepID=A0A0C1IJT5_9BACT|nr:hypothetical protein [Flavihumibacter solisilvae]KIC94435.1 hypothetical protein OI18_12580 [Flavihumibacter solisilvae]
MRKYIEIIFCRSVSVLKDEISVLVLLSTFLTINALVLIGFFKVVFLNSDHILIPRLFQLLIYVGICGWNYYQFVYGKKYQSICEREAGDNLRALGNKLVIGYIILTLILMICLVLLVRSRY